MIKNRKRQSHNPSSNHVIWIHADPITGSKQEVVKSGAGAGREEYEPLGQKVRLTAPIVLDPPGSSPTPITNAAGFPEWQCALPLQIIPSQCGLRILAKEEFVLGIWSESAEGNASNIPDSPIPDLELFSVSDEVVSEVLTSSAKTDEKVENEIARVQSLPANDPLLGTDASESGQQLQTRQQTSNEPSANEQKRPKAKFDLEKFKKCLRDLFKTELGPDDHQSNSTLFAGFFGNNKEPFSILIDYSKNTQQVRRDSSIPGAIGYSPDDFVMTIYVANDLNAIDTFVTKIHEIGNKIYARFKTVGLAKPEVSTGLRRKLKKAKIDDDDAGMALEECVYGGRVFFDGTVLK